MPRKDKYPPYTPYNPPVEQCTRFPPRDTASSVDNTLAGAPQRPLDEGRLQGGEEDLQGVAGGKNVKVHSSDGPNYPMDQPGGLILYFDKKKLIKKLISKINY